MIRAGVLRRHAALLASCCLLTSCARFPVYQPPTNAELPTTFAVNGPATALPLRAAPDAEDPAQAFSPGTRPVPEWWTQFGNPVLDQLVAEALERHPDIAAAEAALLQARFGLQASTAQALVPQVSGQGAAARQREPAATSGAGAPLAFNLFNASVGVNYQPDLFGGIHQALEGLGAQVDLQRFQLDATRLTLAANLVTTAFREAGLRAQREATLELVDFLQQQQDLAKARLARGAATAAEILTADFALRQAALDLPGLDKALMQTRNQLATYVGRPVGASALPEFKLAGFTLPASLPLSVPSEVARQRPDLRAAEAALRAANAAVGVAQANRYPSLTLSGSLGFASTLLPGLTRSDNLAWSLGSSLTAPLFDGGALAARADVARAAYQQVDAQYRAAVLKALQDVVDVLAALQHDARTLEAQRGSVASAQATAELVRQQLDLGAATRQQWLLARINVLQAAVPLGSQRATRLADTAALFQALGGGWSPDAPTDTQARQVP